ncbi:MAG: hypothetical protein HUU55_21510 [Myxococcales bacterium]|nr:hypothetical protein [Myxococcales bacterium]
MNVQNTVLCPQATLDVCNAIGRLMEFWGFKRNLGRIWTLLYLHPHPLTVQQIQEALVISSGASSMALQDLEHWGVAHRRWAPGERKDYWEAETDIWKMVTRVMNERERNWIREAMEVFDEGKQALLVIEKTQPDIGQLAQYQRTRVDILRLLATMGENLLIQLVQTGTINAAALKDLPTT